MPRTWLHNRHEVAHIGSPEPPTVQQMLLAVYGTDWRARLAAVHGRAFRTVEQWGTERRQIPRDVLRHILDHLRDPKYPYELRRSLERSFEMELQLRTEAAKYAERWVSLILSGQARFTKRKPRKSPSKPGAV